MDLHTTRYILRIRQPRDLRMLPLHRQHLIHSELAVAHACLELTDVFAIDRFVKDRHTFILLTVLIGGQRLTLVSILVQCVHSHVELEVGHQALRIKGVNNH